MNIVGPISGVLAVAGILFLLLLEHTRISAWSNLIFGSMAALGLISGAIVVGAGSLEDWNGVVVWFFAVNAVICAFIAADGFIAVREKPPQ